MSKVATLLLVIVVGSSSGGIPAVLGLECYSCSQFDSRYGCTQTTTCGRDEVCEVSLGYPLNGYNLKSGCFSKLACQRLTASPGVIGKRAAASCFKCCDSNLCNDNCNNTAALKSTPSVPTRPSCVDVMDLHTCQTARQIVCKSITTATNAGCKHTCGFC